MNAFVVGASGYIGKSLYEQAKGSFVVSGSSSSGHGEFAALELDALDKFDFGLTENADVIFLAAAISAPDTCASQHQRAWEVNVTGTSLFIRKVMEQGSRVVFFSSDTVYGETENEVHEQAVCRPAGEYAEMKHEVEQRFLGEPLFKTIRLSYVFSSEDKFTKYLAGCARHNEEAEVFHPFYRAIIHRDDVVEGAIALARKWNDIPQGIINFGGPEVLARTEFAETLQQTAMPDLRFRVQRPDAAFFKNRPREIRMTSPLLPSLLGRPPHNLREAASIEFRLNRRIHHD